MFGSRFRAGAGDISHFVEADKKQQNMSKCALYASMKKYGMAFVCRTYWRPVWIIKPGLFAGPTQAPLLQASSLSVMASIHILYRRIERCKVKTYQK